MRFMSGYRSVNACFARSCAESGPASAFGSPPGDPAPPPPNGSPIGSAEQAATTTAPSAARVRMDSGYCTTRASARFHLFHPERRFLRSEAEIRGCDQDRRETMDGDAYPTQR